MHLFVFIGAIYLAVATAGKVHKDSYYSKFNDAELGKHTMVKYKGFGRKCKLGGKKVVVKSGPVTEEEKQSFLKFHNDYRRKVAKGEENRGEPGPQPSASNMKELTWDDEIAAFAQRWAEQCPDAREPHDKNIRNERWDWVGQNMFSDGDQSVPMFGLEDPPFSANVAKAVKFWTLEAAYMNPGNISPFQYQSRAGHYSQLVWADAEKLGCGFMMTKESRFSMFYTINTFRRYTICNFGPGGNVNGLNMYELGPAGSKCPGGTSNNDGLCASDSGGS